MVYYTTQDWLLISACVFNVLAFWVAFRIVR
jgi:hypothetical protein